MATPLLDGSIIGVTFWTTYQNQQLLNTLHYWFQLPGNAPAFRPELADFLSQIQAAGGIKDKVIAMMHTSAKLQYIGAQVLFPTRLKTVYAEPGAAGLKTGTEAPSNVAAVLTKESDFATRWGVGSWHQGGLTQADVVGGSISTALQVQMSALGAQILLAQTTPSGATYTPIIWSPQFPSRITPILDTYSQDTSRVMRRRTHRLGI